MTANLKDTLSEKKFAIIVILIQVIFIILFAIFTTYGEDAQSRTNDFQGFIPKQNDLHPTYGLFQNVHVMVFLGFGFLMTFLKRYGYSAVSFNFLLSSMAIQWSILVQGLIRSSGSRLHLEIGSLVEGDIAAASVLITYGVLLGRTGPLQLIVVTTIEIVIFSLNVHIGVDILGASDAGGSMFIHVFGAYFGLACSRVLNKNWHAHHVKDKSECHSDLFSMVGTMFLWMCWPSFNAALVPDDQQYRAIINTYLSLVACVLITFAASQLVNPNGGKFDIEHIQNATLAGGVGVGAVAHLMIQPFAAMIIGALAGLISIVGVQYLSPFFTDKLGIHDTCGVHNLHGMPGVFSGIAGIIAAACANSAVYGDGLEKVYPERAFSASLNETGTLLADHLIEGRSAGMQAGMQAAALVVTLVMAIVGGVIAGLVLKWDFWKEVKEKHAFDDALFWIMPGGPSIDTIGMRSRGQTNQSYQAVTQDDHDGIA